MAPPLLLHNELVILPYTVCSNYLYRYDIAQDTWTKSIEYPRSSVNYPEFESIYHSAAIDPEQNIIFIFNELGQLIELDLNTETFNESERGYHDGSHSFTLMIDGKCHVFGGWGSVAKKHCIWNRETQTLDEISAISMIENMAWSNVHHMAQDKVLIVAFGTDLLYTYSLESHIVEILPIKWKHEVHFPCSVMTADKRYIINFGIAHCPLLSEQRDEDPRIQILDLHTMTVSVSRVLCPLAPQDGTFTGEDVRDAVIVSNKERDEVLVFGFIRHCWTSRKFEHLQAMPVYMMQMVAMWYCHEMVHVFCNGNNFDRPDSDDKDSRLTLGEARSLSRDYKSFHWKINIDKILQDVL